MGGIPNSFDQHNKFGYDLNQVNLDYIRQRWEYEMRQRYLIGPSGLQNALRPGDASKEPKETELLVLLTGE